MTNQTGGRGGDTMKHYSELKVYFICIQGAHSTHHLCKPTLPDNNQLLPDQTRVCNSMVKTGLLKPQIHTATLSLSQEINPASTPR